MTTSTVTNQSDSGFGARFALGEMRKYTPAELKSLRTGEGDPQAVADFRSFMDRGGCVLFDVSALKPVKLEDMPAELQATLSKGQPTGAAAAPVTPTAATAAEKTRDLLSHIQQSWSEQSVSTLFKVDGHVIAALHHDGTMTLGSNPDGLTLNDGRDMGDLFDVWGKATFRLSSQPGNAGLSRAALNEKAAAAFATGLEQVFDGEITTTAIAPGNGPTMLELRQMMYPGLSDGKVLVQTLASLADAVHGVDAAQEDAILAQARAEIESWRVLDLA